MIKIYYIGGPLDREVKAVETAPQQFIRHRNFEPFWREERPPELGQSVHRCLGAESVYLTREVLVEEANGKTFVALFDGRRNV